MPRSDFCLVKTECIGCCFQILLHRTADLIILQILLGDRYGKSALLRTMPAGDYELFRDVAEEKRVKDGNLLQTWYEYDENAVPPNYIFKVHSCFQTTVTC